MDKKLQILLGSHKNIRSVNTDSYDKIELFNNVAELTEYDVNDVVNSTEVSDDERESTSTYRIYGKIEYMSILNGLKNNYIKSSDFFLPTFSENSKTILNSFNFYLVKPAVSGYTEIVNSDNYVRFFEVIATPNDFELFPIGFANNVYGEQAYSFNFKKDFDVSDYYDQFKFPITELFLYAQYIPKSNGLGTTETMKFTDWNTGGTLNKRNFISTTLNIGDIVQTYNGLLIGDLIEYNQTEFTQTQISGQTIYVSTPCKDDLNVDIDLVWKFNPFIPFRLRYLSNELNSANSGSTSYDLVESIPDYATLVDNNGNFVWRTIVPQGYTEPLTGLVVDYPFINNCRYLFSTIIFSVIPDLTDIKTAEAFDEIWFSKNATNLNITPNSDLDNIGKPCQ